MHCTTEARRSDCFSYLVVSLNWASWPFSSDLHCLTSPVSIPKPHLYACGFSHPPQIFLLSPHPRVATIRAFLASRRSSGFPRLYTSPYYVWWSCGRRGERTSPITLEEAEPKPHWRRQFWQTGASCLRFSLEIGMGYLRSCPHELLTPQTVWFIL